MADRFHVLRNLADTLLPVFEQYAQAVRVATGPTVSQDLPPNVVEGATPAVPVELIGRIPPPTPSPKHQAQAARPRAVRRERYERARELLAQGWPLRAIGRELGLNRNTVRSYVRATNFPEHQPRARRQHGLLDPYIPYLIERWNAGCRTGTLLWKEIIERFTDLAGSRPITPSWTAH